MDEENDSNYATKPGHQLHTKARTNDIHISENVTFPGLMLSENVLKGLHASGFSRPSPIQLKSIPLGRCGLDLIVQAKSGTGKTCVFTVISLENILLESQSTQVLILAPTREIAVQIWEVINAIGKWMPKLRCYTFIGGLSLAEDVEKLKKCHIAVGTPGRIQQLIDSQAMCTDNIRLFVLDEADKLLEPSFQENINWIYSSLPENKQMLALSATYTEDMAKHLTAYMRNPTFVRLNSSDPALLGIRQYYKNVPYHPLTTKALESKTNALKDILSAVNFQQCLVFTNFQTRAQSLSDVLVSSGWPSTYISGAQAQEDRLTAMAKLKGFQCRILISTDLTARGIDAENVNLVINVDIPQDHETYLHRIGRAGRYGAYGAAITIASEGQEANLLNIIEDKCNTHIDLLPYPIPHDLAKESGYVNIDDLVSTEQINTDVKSVIDKPVCSASSPICSADSPTGTSTPIVCENANTVQSICPLSTYSRAELVEFAQVARKPNADVIEKLETLRILCTSKKNISLGLPVWFRGNRKSNTNGAQSSKHANGENQQEDSSNENIKSKRENGENGDLNVGVAKAYTADEIILNIDNSNSDSRPNKRSVPGKVSQTPEIGNQDGNSKESNANVLGKRKRVTAKRRKPVNGANGETNDNDTKTRPISVRPQLNSDSIDSKVEHVSRTNEAVENPNGGKVPSAFIKLNTAENFHVSKIPYVSRKTETMEDLLKDLENYNQSESHIENIEMEPHKYLMDTTTCSISSIKETAAILEKMHKDRMTRLQSYLENMPCAAGTQSPESDLSANIPYSRDVLLGFKGHGIKELKSGIQRYIELAAQLNELNILSAEYIHLLDVQSKIKRPDEQSIRISGEIQKMDSELKVVNNNNCKTTPLKTPQEEPVTSIRDMRNMCSDLERVSLYKILREDNGTSNVIKQDSVVHDDVKDDIADVSKYTSDLCDVTKDTIADVSQDTGALGDVSSAVDMDDVSMTKYAGDLGNITKDTDGMGSISQDTGALGDVSSAVEIGDLSIVNGDGSTKPTYKCKYTGRGLSYTLSVINDEREKYTRLNNESTTHTLPASREIPSSDNVDEAINVKSSALRKQDVDSNTTSTDAPSEELTQHWVKAHHTDTHSGPSKKKAISSLGAEYIRRLGVRKHIDDVSSDEESSSEADEDESSDISEVVEDEGTSSYYGEDEITSADPGCSVRRHKSNQDERRRYINEHSMLDRTDGNNYPQYEYNESAFANLQRENCQDYSSDHVHYDDLHKQQNIPSSRRGHRSPWSKNRTSCCEHCMIRHNTDPFSYKNPYYEQFKSMQHSMNMWHAYQASQYAASYYNNYVYNMQWAEYYNRMRGRGASHNNDIYRNQREYMRYFTRKEQKR